MNVLLRVQNTYNLFSHPRDMFDQTFFRDLARKIFWIWFDNISLPQIKNNLMMRLNARIKRALISQAQEWGGGGGLTVSKTGKTIH